jgi:hypothetical protein
VVMGTASLYLGSLPAKKTTLMSDVLQNCTCRTSHCVLSGFTRVPYSSQVCRFQAGRDSW